MKRIPKKWLFFVVVVYSFAVFGCTSVPKNTQMYEMTSSKVSTNSTTNNNSSGTKSETKVLVPASAQTKKATPTVKVTTQKSSVKSESQENSREAKAENTVVKKSKYLNDIDKFSAGKYSDIIENQLFSKDSTITTKSSSFKMTFQEASGSKAVRFHLKKGETILFYSDQTVDSGKIEAGFINSDTNQKIDKIKTKNDFDKFVIKQTGNYMYLMVLNGVKGKPATISVKWKIIKQ